MSGDRRVRNTALIATITMFALLVLFSGICAADDDPTEILDVLNKNQNATGSWDDDYGVTAEAVYAKSIGDPAVPYMTIANEERTWLIDNYDNNDLKYFGAFGSGPYGTRTHSQSYILMTDPDSDGDGLYDAWIGFQDTVDSDLISLQRSDGSWNGDTGDTALTVYSRGVRQDTFDEASLKGIQWLLDNEDKDKLTWGSISDDSKAILALNSAGFDMWEEIAALMLKQRPDGSFGGIEETSWAVIALSSNLNEESMERMERAVAWLRSQEYDNNVDLANAALAEQYYESSLDSWDPPDDGLIVKKGQGAGLIPPPLMFILSIIIISAIVLGYFLFARLERNAELSGIRKDLYNYIAEHPGEHLAHITKKFQISSSSTRYHLSVLEGMDQIVSHKNGKYKRFYINKNGYSKYTNGNGYKHIMSALKNVTSRKIVKFLLKHPGSNQKSVSNALKIHPSTVNWHAERLKDAEILSKNKKGKEIVYSLNQDVQVRKVIGILEGSVA
jgi:predicted transcriptional regulator